jgi:hypothetical protein
MSPKKQGEVWQGTLSIMVLKTFDLLGPQHARAGRHAST